jgi:peptide/nickel transport system substrate-binding protein
LIAFKFLKYSFLFQGLKNGILCRSVVISILVILGFSALPLAGLSRASAQPGVLRLALDGIPESLNQLTAAPGCVSCWEIMELEYAFGMPVQSSGATYPQAGLFDWISSNANATVWDFNIRTGATWSDGTPITSADVNFTFGLTSGYIFNTPADFLGLGANVASVTALNSSETQFNLTSSQPSFGPLLAAQSYYAIVPQHILQGTQFNATNNFDQDVTSGPFYHLTYDGGSSLVLKANPHYWNTVGLSEIDVTFVSESSQAPTLLAGNTVDLAQVTPDLIKPFLNNPAYGIDAEPARGILYLEYNISESPFSTLAFRQALAYAINTSDISQRIYNGYSTPGILGEGTIPPSATAFHNPNTVQYPANFTMAKSLLAGAGYTFDGSGHLHYPNGTAVSFKIYTDSDIVTDYETANEVSSDLAAIGIQTTVIQETLQTIAGDYTSGTGDIRSQLVIASNTSPIFGLGFLDIEPGFDIYFPWFVSQPAWLSPASAQRQFNNLTNIVNTSTNTTAATNAVRAIDLLNSQYLPLVVLGYPDTIWVYRTGGFSNMPTSSSTNGFDMGAISLDPFTFSQISEGVTSTTSGTTTSASSGAPSTTTAPATTTSAATTTSPATPTSSNTLLLAAGVVVVVIVVAAAVAVGLIARRRSASAPSEPSPNV